MNAYKKLINNSMIFAIGNFGSKIISLLLVPLYTYYLTTVEYGVVDLVLTSVGMLLPIISLSIYESVLRYTMEKSDDFNYHKKVFTNSLFITIMGNFVFLPILILFTVGRFSSIEYKYFLIILVIQSFQFLLSQFSRAIGKVKLFAINGILMTTIISVTNIIFLIVLKRGLSGYFESLIISNLVSVLFFCFFLKISKFISIETINFRFCKEMLKYSIPLIPNALIWWVINTSNRYFILYFSTAADNGLYAVANKLPTILTVVYSIFFQAWQLSAIEEFGENTDSKFYKNIYDMFISITFLVSSFIIFATQPLFKIVIAENFFESWRAVPFLVLGVMYSGFANFMGMFYIAAKKTKTILLTSILSAIISILANFLFIPKLGFIGAAISTMISFFIMWLVRSYNLKSIMELKLNNISYIYHILIFFQIGLLFYVKNLLSAMIIQLFFVLCMITIFILENKFLMVKVYKKLKNRL